MTTLKLALTVTLLTMSAFAQTATLKQSHRSPIYQHLRTALLDVYVDSSVSLSPDLPGMDAAAAGEAKYSVYLSIATTDSFTGAFAVHFRVMTADGTMLVFRSIVDRVSPGNTVARFDIGNSAPVKIVTMEITRMHAEFVEHPLPVMQ